MLGKLLRIIAIILMGLTAALMVLGGIGTICIAFWPEKYESLAMMIPYKPVYQVAAILTILGGLAGIWITVALRRFNQRHYTYAVLILLLSLATAGVKMYFSSRLRGSVAPTNIRFDFTLAVLLYFLFLRVPGIWEKVKSAQPRPDANNTGAAIAAIIGGALTLTVQYWAGPAHTFQGINYADAWHTPLAILGWMLIAGGVVQIGRVLLHHAQRLQPEKKRKRYHPIG